MLVAGGVATYLLWPQPPPEEQVVNALLAVAEAVERKDVGGCLKHVSDDYRDSVGNTKRELMRRAWAGFREVGELNVSIHEPRVQVQGETAAARFRVVIQQARDGRIVQTLTLNVQSTFRREGRRWRAISAEGWQPAEVEL